MNSSIVAINGSIVAINSSAAAINGGRHAPAVGFREQDPPVNLPAPAHVIASRYHVNNFFLVQAHRVYYCVAQSERQSERPRHRERQRQETETERHTWVASSMTASSPTPIACASFPSASSTCRTTLRLSTAQTRSIIRQNSTGHYYTPQYRKYP
eukprot:3605235-Rhodomonas_salina.1